MNKKVPNNGVGRNVFLPTNVDIPGPGKYDPSENDSNPYRKYGFLSKAERFRDSNADTEEEDFTSHDSFHNDSKIARSELNGSRLTGIGQKSTKRILNRPLPPSQSYRQSVLRTPRLNSSLNTSEKRKRAMAEEEQSVKKHNAQLENKANELIRIKKDFDDMNKKLQKENEERHNLQLQELDKKYMELLTIQSHDAEQEKERNKALNDKIAEYEETFADLQIEIDELIAEKQDLQNSCIDLENSLNNSTDKIEELEHTINHLNSLVDQHTAENQRLKILIESETQAKNKLQEQLDLLEKSHKSEIEKISKALQSEKGERVKLQESIKLEQIHASTQLQQAIKELELKKDQEMITAIQNLKEQHYKQIKNNESKFEKIISENQKAADDITSHNNFLSAKLASLEPTIDDLKLESAEIRQKLQNELDLKADLISEKTTANSVLETLNESLQKNVQDLKARVEILETELDKKTQNINELSKQNNLLHDNIDQLSQSLSKSNNQVNHTIEQLSKVKNEYSEQKAHIQISIGEKDQIIADLREEMAEKDSSSSEELAALEQQLSEYKQALAGLENEKLDTETKNRELTKAIEESKAKVYYERNQFESRQNKHENEIKKLNLEIRKMELEHGELARESKQRLDQISRLESQVVELENLKSSKDMSVLEYFISHLCERFGLRQDIDSQLQVNKLLSVIDEQVQVVSCIQDYRDLANDATEQLEKYKEHYDLLRQTLVNAEQDMSDMQCTISNLQMGDGNQYKFLGLLAGCFNYQQAYLKGNHADVFVELESSLFEYCTLNKVFNNKDILNVAKVSSKNKNLDWSTLVTSIISSIPDSLQLATSDILKLHLQSILDMLSVEQNGLENISEQIAGRDGSDTSSAKTTAGVGAKAGNHTKTQKINFIDSLKDKNTLLASQNRSLEKSLLILSTKLASLEREFLSYKEVWFDQPN